MTLFIILILFGLKPIAYLFALLCELISQSTIFINRHLSYGRVLFLSTSRKV